MSLLGFYACRLKGFCFISVTLDQKVDVKPYLKIPVNDIMAVDILQYKAHRYKSEFLIIILDLDVISKANCC